MLLQRLLEGLASTLLGVLAGLAREPLSDLVPRPGGDGDREPVPGGPTAELLRGQDLDEVAALELVVEGDDAPVDLRADGSVPDVRVHRVGEVDRGRAGGQRLDSPSA